MLSCKVNLNKLTPSDLSCGICDICKQKSKMNYNFHDDLASSATFVSELEEMIESETGYKCHKPAYVKDPDIQVIDITKNNRLVCRVEAKHLRGNAFMKIKDFITDKLEPKETIVVDEPKLLSYFARKKEDVKTHSRYIPTYIVWKFDKPCADVGGITVFQEVDVLEKTYMARGRNRAYERRMGDGDCVGGQKMGITQKYHYSITECRPIEELIPEILSL